MSDEPVQSRSNGLPGTVHRQLWLGLHPSGTANRHHLRTPERSAKSCEPAQQPKSSHLIKLLGREGMRRTTSGIPLTREMSTTSLRPLPSRVRCLHVQPTVKVRQHCGTSSSSGYKLALKAL